MADMSEVRNNSLEIFFPKTTDQKPCKYIGSEIKNIKGDKKYNGNLTDNRLSKIRNNVNNVNTKPTPLAARSKAIVLIAETVYIFMVKFKAYIPTP